MKSQLFSAIRYEADEGKVFDWKEPHINVDEDGNETQEHLYAKTLFIGYHDDINNYIEVDKPIEEENAE